MSDDPWGKYTTPGGARAAAAAAAPPPPVAPPAAPANDPWGQYTGAAAPAATPAAAAPAASNAGPDPLDPSWHPTGNAFLDFMSRPRAKREDPLSAAMDTGLSLQDAATFGYGTKALGAQKQVAQANANLGVLSPLVQGIGYAAGPGKFFLGPLARGTVGMAAPALTDAGVSLGARIGGSMAAGGLEGTAAGGLGAAGHDGDIGQGMLTGGITGTALGAFGGSGPARKAPEVGEAQGATAQGVPIAPTGMYAARDTAYRPLDGLYFDTHGDAMNRAATVIANQRNPLGRNVAPNIPDDVMSILTDKNGLANPEVTGRTIQDASRDLRNTNDWTGHRYADQLDNVLRYDTPSAGGQAGEAWDAKQAGDLWHGRIGDLERLSAETPSGQPGPTPTAVAKTMTNYDPGTPQYDALKNLQSKMGPGVNWWHLRHIVAPIALEGAASSADMIDPQHQNPWLRPILHGAAAASLFSGAPAGIRAVSGIGRGSALGDARFAIGTGQPSTTMGGRLGNTLLDLMLGRASSNQSPY